MSMVLADIMKMLANPDGGNALDYFQLQVLTHEESHLNLLR